MHISQIRGVGGLARFLTQNVTSYTRKGNFSECSCRTAPVMALECPPPRSPAPFPRGPASSNRPWTLLESARVTGLVANLQLHLRHRGHVFMLCHPCRHPPYSCCTVHADIANCVGVAAILLLLYAGEQRLLKKWYGASGAAGSPHAFTSGGCLAGLYLCIGKPFLPGHHGSAFAIIVVWVAAMVGSFLAEVVRVPLANTRHRGRCWHSVCTHSASWQWQCTDSAEATRRSIFRRQWE